MVVPKAPLLVGALGSLRRPDGFLAQNGEVAIHKAHVAGAHIVVNDLSPYPEGEVAAMHSFYIRVLHHGDGRVGFAQDVGVCGERLGGWRVFGIAAALVERGKGDDGDSAHYRHGAHAKQQPQALPPAALLVGLPSSSGSSSASMWVSQFGASPFSPDKRVVDCAR